MLVVFGNKSWCALLFILLCSYIVPTWAATAQTVQHNVIDIDSTAPESTDPRVEELLKILKTPVAEYQPTRVSDVINPKAKIKTYEVSWVNAPQYVLNAQDIKGYQRPVKIELTVIAATGYIGASRIVQSSGSKSADQKIQKALQVARLDPIPLVDKNLTYTVIQSFDVKNPL